MEAYWTGAGGTGLANDHRNWNCYSAANKSGLLPGALPMSSTLVVMDTAPASTVVDGDVLNWYQMKLGSAGKGYLAIEEGGSLSTVSWGTVGLTKNYSGQIDQTGGSLRSGAEFSVGENGTGVYNQSGGSSYYTGTLYIGRNGSGVGTYNLSGGSLETSGNNEFQVGSSGKGTFNQTAGSVKAGNWFSIGRVAGAGVYNISGGSLTVSKTDRPLWLGGDNASGVGTLNISGTAVVNFNGGVDAGRMNKSHGYINQDGGSLTVSNGDGFNIARDSYATYVQNAGDLVVNCVARLAWGTGTAVGGTYALNGGTATFNNNFYVGVGRVGTFAQSGGTMIAKNGVEIANGGTATGNVTLSGGVLNTPFLRKGAGTANVTFAGGKIVATNATDTAATFFSGLTSFAFGKGGLTFDTAGYDVTMSSGTFTSTASGSLLRKEGAGTFTAPTLPPVAAVEVVGGTLALASGDAIDNTVGIPELAHRWSFNGDYTDSAGGLTAVPTGSPTFSDGKLVLPGGNKGTANVNLGTRVLSIGSDDVTIEIWTKQRRTLTYARIFDYYSSSAGSDTENKKNDIYMAFTTGTSVNTDKVEIKHDNSVKFGKTNTLQPYTLNTMYHVSMVFRANPDGSTTVSWAKRNVGTGTVEKSNSETIAGWTLADFHQKVALPQLHLGCSLWGESDPDAEYDEVRIWGIAMSDAQLNASAKAGPDATSAELASVVGTTDRTLDVASGATLALGGNTLTQPVIAGAGTVQNGTLTVTKKIRVNAGEKLTFSGVALDVTGTTVEVADPENLTQPFVFAESTTAITGKPSVAIKGWTVKKSTDGKKLTIRRSPGATIMVF